MPFVLIPLSRTAVTPMGAAVYYYFEMRKYLPLKKGLFVCCTLLPVIVIPFLFSCGKNKVQPPEPPGDTTVVVKPVPDPPTAPAIGFFLDNWQAKTFAAPSFTEVPAVTSPATNVVTVDASSIITKISNTIFGHNANTWMTPMVTEPLFMNHITNLHPHIIRWQAAAVMCISGTSPRGYFRRMLPGKLWIKRVY